MTQAAAPLHEDAIELAAHELSALHVLSGRRPRRPPALDRLDALGEWMDRAREALAEPDAASAKAAEWLLDNDYLVQRAAMQVEEHLPERFTSLLPALAGGAPQDAPRVSAVARGLLEAAGLQISLPAVTRFVDAYQRHAPLTIAELWALPAMLRLGCLEVLVGALERLVPGLEAPFDAEARALLRVAIDDTECVARAIGSLRAIASISWRDFFRHASVVDAVLARDPARAYAHMDFETCDRYRHAVEALARGARRTEADVAELVVTLARRAAPDAPRRSHVGYWLVAEGREALERELATRPRLAERLRRAARRRAGACYATALAAATAAAAAVPIAVLVQAGAGPLALAIGAGVALLPASALGIFLVHWLASLLFPPFPLPKLDFDAGIPADCATAVVVPVLVASPDEARELVHALELHYLANPDPAARFVLLGDFTDADAERVPGDDEIVAALASGIRALNRRHGGGGAGPFHGIHRPRHYNASEGCWMGWERKRGKLEEFDALARGGESLHLLLHEGDRDALQGVRFVITLDADTRLPKGALARLVGLLAHPLNRAEFDRASGRVRAGYTVVQPRIEIAPESGNRSLFSRFYSGDTAIDIYSRAASDVYQDLFGSGIYAGKGIYEVETFRRSLEGRVPENALASHDLFEGIHGRAALATDVVLYEDFPASYLGHARRLHRWVRGDWQLLPWLGRTVPAAGGERLRTRLSGVGRWQIFDNLRRSALPVGLLALAAAGWLGLPGSPWIWTLLAVLPPGEPLVADFVMALARRSRVALRGAVQRSADHAGRWLLVLAFLPHEAWLTGDAIARTLVRLGFTRRHFLEWQTAAHVSSDLAGDTRRAAFWRVMWPAPAAALALGAAIVALRPEAFAAAAPLLALWLAAPEIARAVSLPRRVRVAALAPDDRALLRSIARRTWLFFETFVGPDDQWLPPDNYQEDPGAEIAHRTSPTNVGMMLLSSLAAWDLGYVGLPELASRLANSLEALKRAERYRGHVLNWYDTRTLEPLEPRYVSTVDSGNLAVSLLALKEGCRELAGGPLLRPARFDGLADTAHLLESALRRLPSEWRARAGAAPAALLRDMCARAVRVRERAEAWPQALTALCDGDLHRLDELLSGSLRSPDGPAGPEVLRDVRIWLERLHHHVRSLEREMQSFFPWVALLAEPPPALGAAARELVGLLPLDAPLADLAARCERARAVLAQARAGAQAGGAEGAWLDAAADALAAGERAAAELRAELRALASSAESEALGMDFRLLYDSERRLFHVGYNVGADRLDPHHYDLLASEARLASFFAIAKGDVPVEHWFHLGRPVTRVDGALALLSWGGSMFEYLMPPLLLRSQAGTLLAESSRAAVAAQRRHGAKLGVPWGISESGFAALDPDRHYRYRAFGVPELGFRRGLARDVVVAPYATALALPVAAAEALENLRLLEELGLVGTYGFYEAADFTPDRVAEGARLSVVRSYMAHHQGMLLAALDNQLCDDALVSRFAADPRVQTVELLLHERVPTDVSPEQKRAAELEAPRPAAPAAPRPGPWRPAALAASPELHALGNGRLLSLVGESGSGGLRWRDAALTRWTPDATRDACGLWIYVRDLESGALWSAARQPTGAFAHEAWVAFHAHQVEFHRRDHAIAVRMEVSVAPADDVEIRLITVTNESDRERRLAVTSYAEVVLAAPNDDARHPAFSKLFVQAERLPALDGLLFTRRARRPEERPPALLHRILSDDPAVRCTAFETDRERFLGRLGSARRPAGLAQLSSSEARTLDPVMALETILELAPNETRRIAFLTLAAGSRETLLEIAERYDSLAALEWVIEDGAANAARELQRLGIAPERLPEAQALLSLTLHPHPALRAAADALTANALGQPRLWGMGISGDLPIVLLRTRADPAATLLADLARAHELWRQRGVAVDLVVLSQLASGYTDPLHDRLGELLHGFGGPDLVGRRGGVHWLRADQIGDEERRLLECTARVVLDDAAGPLARQLAEAGAEPRELPRFQPSAPVPAPEPTPALGRPSDLLFDNGLGGFSADGREYVIHLEPGERTPAPWCNVLANEDFGCVVTEAGGGYTWALNSAENRLTPWANDPVCDPAGEALYLRDEESARCWTPAPRPAGDATPCQVRHGAGYTTWRRNGEGLEQTLTVFVPLADPVKIVRLQLRNLWPRTRRLTATYYAEWVLGPLRESSAPFVVPIYDAVHRALLARSAWNPDFGERVAFLASDQPPHGLTTDRGEFLGREGDAADPAALRRWGLSGAVRPGADPCAALQVHLEVAEGETREVIFVLGQGRDLAHAHQLLERWRDPGAAEAELARVHEHWDRLLGAVEVRTPERELDLLVNRWLLYQAVSARLLGRTGYYQSSGAIGFRDQLQDVLALVHVDPGRVRAHLLESARHQFVEGDVLHWWHPPNGRGVRTRCSDDLLWLPFAVCRYVAATGDAGVLDEPVEFLKGAPLAREQDDVYGSFERDAQPRSLFEHCERALERGVTRGPNGLPLIGAGDWNDGMNRVGVRGRGESVWLAWFCIAVMEQFAELCARRGDDDLCRSWRRRAELLAGTVESAAWDGEWYVRAFDDDGRAWGSAASEECRIDSISQSWAALCGAARPERALIALHSAERELVREQEGVVRLLWPPFDATPRDPGYIRAYPPGVRENGGQYTHAAAWLGWAFAAVGDGDRAARVLRTINPIRHATSGEGVARYRVEPYVIAADVGAVSPHVGRGGWTWYTGAAGWAWRLAVEAILGLQREGGKLRIAPCLPRGWGGYQATLRGEGGVLHVQVEDPDGVGCGEIELSLDGVRLGEPLVALPSDGAAHRLRVRLRRAADSAQAGASARVA